MPAGGMNFGIFHNLTVQGSTPHGLSTEDQWVYDDWVARECGLAGSPAEPWRRRLAPLMRQRIFQVSCCYYLPRLGFSFV